MERILLFGFQFIKEQYFLGFSILYTTNIFMILWNNKTVCWVNNIFICTFGYSDDNLLVAPSFDYLREMLRTSELSGQTTAWHSVLTWTKLTARVNVKQLRPSTEHMQGLQQTLRPTEHNKARRTNSGPTSNDLFLVTCLCASLGQLSP